MTAIHQFLPTFAGRDAIGMHVLRLQRLLRDAGFDSDIYAVHRHDEVMQSGYDFDEFRRRNPLPAETWGLYHYSIGSPMVEKLREYGVQLALDYHNITEARFFLRWDATAAITMFDGVLGEGGGRTMIDRLQGRMADPAEMAAVAAFLLSDDASMITGTTQFADGGTVCALW